MAGLLEPLSFQHFLLGYFVEVFSNVFVGFSRMSVACRSLSPVQCFWHDPFLFFGNQAENIGVRGDSNCVWGKMQVGYAG